MNFFICTFLLCISSFTSTTRIPKLPALSLLCPNQNVCSNITRTTNTTATELDNSNAGCCTECSCEANCSLDGTCCFTSMNNHTDRKYQSCVSIQLKEYTDRYKVSKAYYMVTKLPQNGCVFSNEGITGHDLDTDIVPWGNLMPVTSLATKTIYKNQKLAECHGDKETIVWVAYLACDTIKSVDDDLENCNINFNYPGSKDDIRHERCFTEKASKCPDTFKLNRGVALAPEDVRAACTSDFQSEYSAVLPVKNVYCFLCLTGKFPWNRNLDNCNSSGIRSQLIEFNSFVSLIELGSQVIHLQQMPQKSFSHPNFCELRNGQMTSNCRKAVCPSGQIRSRLNGKCTFASSRWLLSKKDLNIVIKVSITSTTGTFTNHHLAKLINTGRLKIVLKNWSFQYWMLEYVRDFQLDTNQSGPLSDFESAENLTATHFYAVFVYDEGEVEPQQFLRETRRGFEKTVVLKWQNYDIRMKQTLAKTSRCYLLGFVNADPSQIQCIMLSYLVRTDNNSYFFDSANVYLIITDHYPREQARSRFFLTKLMYCSQVEFHDNNIDIHVYYKQATWPYPALVVTKAGRALFDGEFEISRKSSGEVVIKVCHDDVDFVDVSSKASHRCFMTLIQLVMTILMW